MEAQRGTRRWRAWWARKRRERARYALDRMLAFQKAKAQKLRAAPQDPAVDIREYTRYVRSRLERLHPVAAGARVLEVGSGAHGLIFYFGSFGDVRGIGVDPLAHHYVTLFPRWQRRVPTVAACGESIPFPDESFDVVLSDNVIDHAEHPAKILAEIARVLVPEGALYLEVNISHPLYGLFSHLHGLWSALGLPFRIDDFADHPSRFRLAGARQLFRNLPFRVVWEADNIAETRAAFQNRNSLRVQDWVRRVFYYDARYEAIAIREPTSASWANSNARIAAGRD